MRNSAAPLFLARAVYRKRRLRDAARLLPLLGMFLLVLPGLWATDMPASGGDWVYILVVWGGLIAAAAALAPGLAASDPGVDEDGQAR